MNGNHIALGLAALTGASAANSATPAPVIEAAKTRASERSAEDAVRLFETLKGVASPLLAPELAPFLASKQERPQVIGNPRDPRVVGSDHFAERTQA